MNQLIFCIFFIIQVIIESLPISSSGHLKIFQVIFQKYKKITGSLLTTESDYFFHGPTIIILLVFLIRHKAIYYLFDFNYLFLIFLADLITVFFYFLFKFMPSITIPYYSGFLITGLSLASLFFLPAQINNSNLTVIKALLIGVAQGLSLLPGVSRLAITFVCASWLGIGSHNAFVLSCLIQLPLITAGFFKGFLTLFLNNRLSFINLWPAIFIIPIALVISYFVLEIVYKIALNKQFYIFAPYLILPFLLSLLLGL